MRKSFKKPFANFNLLNEMLRLRSQGWHETDLAKKYGCNVSTISHQCKHNNVVPLKKVERRKGIKSVISYPNFNTEPVNEGKEYKDYLKKEREKEKLYLDPNYK